MENSITLNLTDYVVMGTAYITFWDNTEGCIDMESYHIKENNIDLILEGVNDNGFGCQSINTVDIELYANYEGHLVFIEDMFNLEVPKGKGRRGI